MDLKERFNQLDTRAKWGIGIIGAVVVSPIVYTAAVSVISAAAAVAVAGVVGLAIIHGAPVVSMKFANWKIKGIVAEAQENPIETLNNLLIAKEQAFKEFQANVTTAVTARNSFKTKTEEFARKYPARATEFQQQLERMSDLVERKKRALSEAERMLEDGHNKLAEMTEYYKMSQAAQAANRAAGMDTGDIYERLKADTACDAVFESVNRAFAELEVAATLNVESVDKPEQLPYNAPNVIEITPVSAKVKVK